MKVKTKTPIGLRIISLFINLSVFGVNVWACVYSIYNMDSINNPILSIVINVILVILFMINIIRDSIIYAIEDMYFE